MLLLIKQVLISPWRSCANDQPIYESIRLYTVIHTFKTLPMLFYHMLRKEDAKKHKILYSMGQNHQISNSNTINNY
jgi:hypothetical protein